MRGSGGFQGNRGKRPQRPIPEEGPYRSFVGNLPNDCIQGDFDTLFNGLSISSIHMMRDRETDVFKGFAYVEFAGREDLEKALALDGADFDGHQLRVDVADDRRNDKRNNKGFGSGERGRGNQQTGRGHQGGHIGNRGDRGGHDSHRGSFDGHPGGHGTFMARRNDGQRGDRGGNDSLRSGNDGFRNDRSGNDGYRNDRGGNDSFRGDRGRNEGHRGGREFVRSDRQNRGGPPQQPRHHHEPEIDDSGFQKVAGARGGARTREHTGFRRGGAVVPKDVPISSTPDPARPRLNLEYGKEELERRRILREEELQKSRMPAPTTKPDEEA